MGTRTAHREKHLGIWQEHGWDAFAARVRAIACGLIALGVRRGDTVSILSEDRKEWLYADQAILSSGAVCSGIYTTDAPAQLSYIVRDSETRVLFVEDDEQLDKFLEVEAELPGLARVVVLDRDGLHGLRHERVSFLEELYGLGEAHDRANPGAYEAARASVRPDDPALLVYTSGTTGPPKGATLTHRALVAATRMAEALTPGRAEDETICFLPLCHVFERLFSGFLPLATRGTVNFAESPETVFDDLREVAPHRFIGVPRLWEKLYAQVTIRLAEATALQRWAFARALEAGRARVAAEEAGRPLPLPARIRLAAWDALVLGRVRRALGMHRLNHAVSGAAPLAPELIRWFRALGVPLREGYGMTETGGVLSLNVEGADRIGTVGRPAPGVRLRIGAGGEIQAAGPNLFAGYRGRPEATAETFTPDGWLRTGDAGALDADGFLRITGRLKDVIITAGGKNVSPAEIENLLKVSPFVADAVAIGDGRRYLTALVMIDRDTVEARAQAMRVPFSDFRSLCAAPEVRALVAEAVEEANRQLARAEQVKDFRIIDVTLAAEDEELTPTMKLKRALVERKHAALVEAMYDA
jgi:long-chain acyl-CoA synthetase